MERKQHTPSVIARLMSLDELPPRQHLPVKRRRVLSENYLQKMASIGLREKSSFSVGFSRGINTQKCQVVKDVSAAKLKMRKYTNSSVTLIKEKHSNLMDSEGISESLLSTKHLRDLQAYKPYCHPVHSAVAKTLCKMSARTTAKEKTSKSLQTLEIGTPKDDVGDCSIHHLKKINFQLDPNENMPHPSTRVIVVKPSSGKYHKTKHQSVSRRHGLESDPVDLKYKKFTEHENGAVHNKRPGRAESISDTFLKAEALKLPSSKLFSKQRKDNTLNFFSKRSSFSKEVKKQTIEKWKLMNDLSEVETTSRSQNLGEMLATDDLETKPQFLDSKRDSQSFCSSFSVNTQISGSCSKDSLIPNHSAGSMIASGSPEGMIGHKASLYGWHLRQKVAVTEKHSKSMNQKQKDNMEYRDLNLKETDQRSPNSVLEPPFQEEKPCTSAFHGLCSVARQLQLLETNSEETYSEGSEMGVSTDGDSETGSLDLLQDSENILKDFKTADGRDFSYLVDVLDEASLHGMNLGMCFETWHSLECPVNPSVFDLLEKKYGKQISWLQSERKLLFDHINSGLSEILHSFLEIYIIEKSLKRRCCSTMRRTDIEEELWRMLVSHENEIRKDLSGKAIGNETKWLQVEEEIGSICREIEKYLLDELVAELALH
ncbi:hypothetical protein KY290_025727 [Solanum tuberosum]|uniref:Phosphatidylinositol n-acetylglucosaminyltransferase subunit p n=2 Tax=Solanum tuberosum TaxID=4113 RepID=M1C5W5_SOLTU|nr:PREDICTED: uncharacterized protein LOC102599034 isoform X1 [Solanum tuberosum]XP_015163570.1 PREDICTED: uncharacterized protein LOC102599034 isoform X1 [Solanum tuberosum]XP_015163571.1 PREDICTED: uncharacterized protein LOC102599034 isoform X1 [Solanum tuberosum]KAH0670293.1 hypothetical protein KY289_024786 [Solanum tuberosum]KAH0676737.1 hypothetical protein KY285_024538 [Solanum tuberosum]KAH0755457.1 hypothetical protein KY290_025727 [Solanum tuberosum]